MVYGVPAVLYIPRRGLVSWSRASRKLVLPCHGEGMVRCSSVVEAVGRSGGRGEELRATMEHLGSVTAVN